MSARAMRRLQGDALGLINGTEGIESEEEDEEDDDDEDEDDVAAPRTSFAVLPSDSSSSSSSDEEESDNDDDEKETDGQKSGQDNNVVSACAPPADEKSDQAGDEAAEMLEEKEEDLDAILNEFKEHDSKLESEGLSDGGLDELKLPARSSALLFEVILKDLNFRELDVDWTMRHALEEELIADAGGPSASSKRRSSNSNSRTFLFGSPPQNARRPPSHVGGGIGMTTYEEDATQSIPWPYNQSDYNVSNWYKYVHSDGTARDLDDYRYIQQMGDLNSLLFFVAHHPYVTDALLQLSTVLYQTPNQNQRGLSFLKRSLWVYECASLIRFNQTIMQQQQQQQPSRGTGWCFMDYDIAENQVYLDSLRRLVHVSSVAGLWRTALAVSRFVLALDPLRDPLSVLAVMDSYALSCHSDKANEWLVDLVESRAVRILVPSGGDASDVASSTGDDDCQCDLSDMPNWAYSLALALCRIHGGEDEKTRTAMQRAIRAFPAVVGRLLQAAEVDTTGRSLRRDWMTVLDQATSLQSRLSNLYLAESSSGRADPIVTAACTQAVDKLVDVYVELSAKVWSDDDALQLLYDNLVVVVEDKDDEPATMPPLRPALMRYARLRPSDWATRIQQLPEDANIVDPGLVEQAMVIEPNRPRLVRLMQQQRQAAGGGDPLMAMAAGNNNQGLVGAGQQPMFGGPPTGIIDPDLPLLEVFWRSFLPWNHVDGVRVRRDGI